MSDPSKYAQQYAHLTALAATLAERGPGVMAAFGRLQHETIEDGALDRKTKELMALGIAISLRCEGCVTFHTHDAMKAGASAEEVIDTIGVAIMMGGGPAVVYGCEALEALEEFTS